MFCADGRYSQNRIRAEIPVVLGTSRLNIKGWILGFARTGQRGGRLSVYVGRCCPPPRNQNKVEIVKKPIYLLTATQSYQNSVYYYYFF